MPNWEQLLGQIDDAPPPDLPGYRVERLISERGQGAVFLARAADGRRVAIKRWKLPTSRAAREVRALQRLDHPGVVRVLEGAVDRGSGLPCVVMDYVDAPTLLAAGRRLPAERAAAILAQVARALAYVHGAGLVHRDVKPGNVLVRPDGAAVLVDFGVVKEQAEPSLPEVTATGGRALGTRPYMAPEQLGLVEAPVGPRADVYALGVTLYQCLTGALPFDSDAAFERRERDPWRAAGGDAVEVDPALRALVSACLAFAPEDRPASAGEVARRLEGWLAAGPSAPGGGPRRVGVGLALGAVLVTGLGAWAALAGERATPRTEAPASAPASVAGLHTLILQPGPLDGRDTFVSSVGLYRNDNFGPEQTLRVGLRPPQSGQAGEELSLLAFTLERLPPGCEVEAAELVLSCMNTLYSSEPAWVEARAVVPSGARTPWVEGTGCHDALVGGVVWDGTFAGLPDPRTHSARPELSRPDLAAEPLDRVQVGEASPDHEREVRLDVTEAVRAWVSRPATNLGLGLTAPAGAPPGAGIRVFHSSESLRPERRPRLVVRYRGAPPLPAADEARALEQAARRARALLPALEACAQGGDWEQAFALGTRAVEEAPFLGEPFLARGLAAERLGFVALARLEVLRSVGCQQPTLVPEGYAALARLSLPLRNPQARIQGLGALTALACERRMEPEVARLYRVALAGEDPAGDRSDWGRHASAMLEILEASRRRLGSEDPALASLPLLVALVHAARADPGAPEAFARARAAWPRHPLSVGFPELPVGPRPAALGAPGPSADWARILVAVGALDAARAQVAQARAAWPDDAELEQLERCLGDR